LKWAQHGLSSHPRARIWRLGLSEFEKGRATGPSAGPARRAVGQIAHALGAIGRPTCAGPGPIRPARQLALHKNHRPGKKSPRVAPPAGRRAPGRAPGGPAFPRHWPKPKTSPTRAKQSAGSLTFQRIWVKG